MSFNGILAKSLESPDCSKAAAVLTYRARRHISKGKLDSIEDVKYVNVGSSAYTDYRIPLEPRYMAAVGITYSIFFSIFDINSSKLMAFNAYGDPSKSLREASALIKGIKRPNLEARIFGMQNGQSTEGLKAIISFLSKHSISISEADIFGNEVRHIALDANLGMSFNVLTEDRNYRPGELISKMTEEQFQNSIRGLYQK